MMRRRFIIGSLTIVAMLAAQHVSQEPDAPAHRHVAAAVGRHYMRVSWTSVENSRPGTTAWRLNSAAPSKAIQGFADHLSVPSGGGFKLYVKSADPWRVSAYRLGYYGGTGGRLVWTSHWVSPNRQHAAITSTATRTVEAPWAPSLTISQTWPPGVYLLKLRTLFDKQSYIPITVRSSSVVGRTVFMSSDMTLQAYNHWGGRSLYTGPDGKSPTRSYAVSFDRPYDANTTLRILDTEQPLIREAERLGLPMAYLSDVDVATRAGILTGARTVVVDGHDEYWTNHQRAAVTAARDHGTNLLFFGANQMWWQVRLGATAVGSNRLVVCYKYAPDPLARKYPELQTKNFRTLPSPMPESRVIGVQYTGLGAEAPFVVYEPAFFAFHDTGAKRGSAYQGLVGPEIDRSNPGKDSATTLEIVGHSLAHCRAGACISESSYYTVASGAGVWAAGTMGWVDALGQGLLKLGATPATKTFVRIVTDNLLLDFADGPAATRYPASPNVSRSGARSNTTPADLNADTD